MKSETYSPQGGAEWPRDFDFRVEVAEQQELLLLQGADSSIVFNNNADEQDTLISSSE